MEIPRGGIELGDIIASDFQCNLDIVVSKKIGAPFNKELAIGAVMPDGIYFLNEHLVHMLNSSFNNAFLIGEMNMMAYLQEPTSLWILQSTVS